MNLVSLLVLPAVISMSDNNARYIVAGIAIVIILSAITYSKTRPSGFGDDLVEELSAKSDTKG